MSILHNSMQTERKDVIRNRAELLAAAEFAVAQHGVDVPLSAIAKAAGVGQGTLYRHFPDRDALLSALLERSMDHLETFAAQQDGDDAMLRVLNHYASGIERYFALSNYLRVVDPDHPSIVAGRCRFSAMMNPLLTRAKAANLVSADVTLIDIRSLIAMLNALPSHTRAGSSLSDPSRMLSWVLKGMRP